jgi:hypothetical protein
LPAWVCPIRHRAAQIKGPYAGFLFHCHSRLEYRDTIYWGISQNAFPCGNCHKALINLSSNYAAKYIVLRVYSNHGQYSRDHGLPNNTTNYLFVYHAGTVSQAGPPGYNYPEVPLN